MEPILAACEQADLLSILNDHFSRLNTKEPHRHHKLHHKSCLDKANYDVDDDSHRKRLEQIDHIRKALSEFDAEQYMSLKRFSKHECNNSMDNIARLDDR